MDLPQNKSPPRHIGRWIGSLLILGVVLFVVCFRWNWLRGPLAWELSKDIQRPVAIDGDLHVHPWSSSPWLTVNNVSVGRPGAQGDMLFISLPRLTAQWRWSSVFAGRLAFPLVWVERPRAILVAGTHPPQKARISPKDLPEIDRLVIYRGTLRYSDTQYRLGFTGGVSTDEARGRTAAPNDSVVEGALVVGSPAWAGPPPLLNAPHLTVRVKLLPLMLGKLSVSLIQLDHPVIYGVRDASGRTNWQFSPNNSVTSAPHVPPIGRLVMSGGTFRYDDARLQLNFLGSASTNETVGDVGHGAFLLQGRGTLRKAPFSAKVSGGPLINIDPRAPYAVEAMLETQGTKVSADASLAHPFDVQNVSGRLRASGPDLADLYHLTGIALPNTPPYDLSTFFARVGSHYALRHMAGRVGESDLEGNISADDTTGRPFLTANLASRRLNLVDLSAMTGGVPKHAAAHALSPIQRQTVAKLTAEHRILPDTHLDVTRIRSTDANVVYRARSVQAGYFPIRGLFMKVALQHGQLSINPLTMTLPQGNLGATVHLDARSSVPTETMDVRLTDVRLENLMGKGNSAPPLEGGLYARLRLSGRGDSVRAVAASANGDVRAVIPQGAMRQTLAELMGIDATKGLFMLITKDQGQTPIRCAVADFHAQAGVLTAQRFVFDTGVVFVTGKGDIDLRDEAFDLQLNGRPKKFRLVRIGAPILVRGTLGAPKFGVDVPRAAGQLAISGILGAVVAPLSALLPFVSPGLAKDADCAALEREVSVADAPPSHAK